MITLKQKKLHLERKRDFSKELLDKLLEQVQIKELKMKFFGMYNWKNFTQEEASAPNTMRGQNDSLDELSVVKPTMITKESPMVHTQIFDDKKVRASGTLNPKTKQVAK